MIEKENLPWRPQKLFFIALSLLKWRGCDHTFTKKITKENRRCQCHCKNRQREAWRGPRSASLKGYIDRDQFTQLEELQDDSNPNFVEEIVSLYYNDSARLIRSIEQIMASKPTDFENLDNYMHQFKGSSSSIGANKVTNACAQFREYCSAGNREGCIRSFQLVKREHEILKKKLDTYFQLARQAWKG